MWNQRNMFAFTDYTFSLKVSFKLFKNVLSLVHFKDGIITCHDLNRLSTDNYETVIGFSTGDIVTYIPLNGKTARYNRHGCIHKFAVTCVKWIPGSESLFICGFEDGSLLIFDKDLEDQSQAIPQSQEE